MFAVHSDVSAALEHIPAGECRVRQITQPRLVCTAENKLCWIEFYFGMNAVGVLPLCAKHLDTPKRDLVCLSRVVQGKRSLEWVCNECRQQCEIALPPLKGCEAAEFLPPAIFAKHNAVPVTYPTKIRVPLAFEDFMYIIRKLPMRRAPGPDGVPNELIRLLPLPVLVSMHAVINDALSKGEFPLWWKQCVVTLMTKKSPPERLANQQPVALLNTVYKLFSIVVNSCLTSISEETGILEPEQEGGRKYRNCVCNLQLLNLLFQDAQRRKKKMFALFVDTTNAFGSVSHRVIWSLLRAYGIPETDVQFLEKLYQGSSFAVSGPFGKTAEIHTHAGVNQGDITSPLIWNLVINALLRYLHGERTGYVHQAGTMTSALAYIDDVCILSDSEHGFCTLLYRLNRFYEWAGLQVNNTKSALFAYDFRSHSPLPMAHYRMQHRPIPPLPLHGTYKYLGMEFSPGGQWAVEKARVRRKLRDCIAALKGSPYLPHQLDRVVRACMLPIFWYGVALVDWTDRELDAITRIWANARRLAWKLAPGTPHALHTLATEWGGGGIPHARLLWAREQWSLLQTCTAHDDTLKRLTQWEWSNSLAWLGVDTEQEAARELTMPILPHHVVDVSNRFRRVCTQLGTAVTWGVASAPPADEFCIAGVTRATRSSAKRHAESVMWDSTSATLQFNRALRALTRHNV